MKKHFFPKCGIKENFLMAPLAPACKKKIPNKCSTFFFGGTLGGEGGYKKIFCEFFSSGPLRAVAPAVHQVHPDAHSESMLGLPTPALTCARWGVHLQDTFPDRDLGEGGAGKSYIMSRWRMPSTPGGCQGRA